MRLLTALVLTFAACDSESAAPTQASVAYVGDSIAFETSSVIAEALADHDLRYTTSAKGGMAICDYLPETEAVGGPGTFRTFEAPVPPNLHDLLVSAQPDVVVMQFWGNSWQFTPCMKGPDDVALAPGSEAYYTRYAADAERAMVVIRDAAASVKRPMPIVLWVLQGPDKGMPERTARLDAIYAALSDRWDSAGTIDAGREVSQAANYYEPGDRYGYSQWLPCTALERETDHCNPAYGGTAQIHKDDDPIHFCLGAVDASGVCDTWSPGIHRYALAISAAIVDEL